MISPSLIQNSKLDTKPSFGNTDRKPSKRTNAKRVGYEERTHASILLNKQPIKLILKAKTKYISMSPGGVKKKITSTVFNHVEMFEPLFHDNGIIYKAT